MAKETKNKKKRCSSEEMASCGSSWRKAGRRPRWHARCQFVVL